jgi:hypothetical protein
MQGTAAPHIRICVPYACHSEYALPLKVTTPFQRSRKSNRPAVYCDMHRGTINFCLVTSYVCTCACVNFILLCTSKSPKNLYRKHTKTCIVQRLMIIWWWAIGTETLEIGSISVVGCLYQAILRASHLHTLPGVQVSGFEEEEDIKKNTICTAIN